MNNPEVVHTASDATKTTIPRLGMIRQFMAYNPHLMPVRHNFERGWKGARHSHPQHQMVYAVRDHTRFQVQGKSWVMRAGDSIVVDGGIEREASAFEPSEVLDVFTPYRQEYA